MRILGTGLGLAEVIVLASLLYFLPGLIAYIYRRERTIHILLLNLFTGWTVIGWFGALKWATIRDSRALEEIAPRPRYDTQNRLIIFALFVALALLIQFVRVYVLDRQNGTVAESPPRKINPASVSIASYATKKVAGESKLDFTIRNSNSFRVKEIVVKCVFAAIDATVLGSVVVTIDRTIEPNFDLRVTDVDLGSIPKGTANSSCATQAFSIAN